MLAGPGGVAVGNKAKGVDGVGDVSAVWNADRLKGRSPCIGIGINAGEAAEALSAVCSDEGKEVQASGVIDGRVAETPVQTESSFTFFTYLSCTLLLLAPSNHPSPLPFGTYSANPN
jgi:hypothetical protein